VINYSNSRFVDFESVINFRDLGGYRTREGRTVAWGRLFRSAGLHEMAVNDITRLREEIGPKAVIDLRTPRDDEKTREIGILNEVGAEYYNIPFRPEGSSYFKEENELFPNVPNLGEIYLYRVTSKGFGEKVVEALEIIANEENRPLIFHCSAGKDRTGVLAAIVLTAAGVIDEDIIADYALTAPFMKEIRDQAMKDPKTPEEVKNLPDYQWEASAESMSHFLSLLRREYGSVAGYLEKQGAEPSLITRLEKAMLV